MSEDAGDHAAWAALGTRLRARGLSERALRYCFGVSCPIHAPLRALAMRGPDPAVPLSPPPAALLAHLFVAGSPIAVDAARRLLGPDLDELAVRGLAVVDAGAVIARVTILPVGNALVVSDRADRMHGSDAVACADDSAFHTLGMVPARAEAGLRWLDVGTGAAIVPLCRPGAAGTIVGTDIHARALTMARMGIDLSGRRDIALRAADLLDGAEAGGPWDRVTFNAPIPASAMGLADDAPLYRRGAGDILERFWRDVRDLVAPGGEVIVHSWQPLAGYPACLDLPGRVVAVRYTPPGQVPAFGVTVWWPDAPRAETLFHIELTPEAPHVGRVLLDRAS
jgi:hypothetical protein